MRHSISLGKVALGVILGCVGLWETRVFAQASMSACINPVGQMRLIDGQSSCNSQERLVTWAVTGPSGPAGPPGPAGASGPVVVDANGAQLGWFNGGYVLMNVNNYWFTVLPTRDGFFTPSMGIAFTYLSPDCTGERYVPNPSNPIVPNAQVLSQQAWFPDIEAPKVFINGTPEQPVMVWNQAVGPNGPTTPCTPSSLVFRMALSPMRSVDVSGFVAPFRLAN